jgi:hypothetical protein
MDRGDGMKNSADHLTDFHSSAVFALVNGQYTLAPAGKPLPDKPGIYAFVQAGEVKYIGSASSKDPIRKRVNAYLKWQVNGGGRTKRPVHLQLREAMAAGPVNVHFRAFDEMIGDWQGTPIHLVLGIEAGLIFQLNPSWNRRGINSLTIELP